MRRYALTHASLQSNSIIRGRYICSSGSSILNSYSDIKTCGCSGHSNSSSNGNIILRLSIVRVEVEVVVVLFIRIVAFFSVESKKYPLSHVLVEVVVFPILVIMEMLRRMCPISFSVCGIGSPCTFLFILHGHVVVH